MGHDKGLALLHGEPFIVHVSRAMEGVVDEIVISVSRGMRSRYEGILDADYVVVEDRRAGLGPLEGLMTVLSAARSEYVLFSPCDTPFLRPKVCELIVSSAVDRDGAVPKTGKSYFEPLHGAYRRRECLPAFEDAIVMGGGRPSYAYERLNLRYVAEQELRAVDPELESFWNINSPRDLESIEERKRNVGH